MQQNLILNTDSYKPSHWLQYPPNTRKVFSYIESRGGLFNETMFAGLQVFLQEYLSKPITLENIEEAEEVLGQHGVAFNKAGWLRLLDKYAGYLPLRIRAVPEGTVIPVKNVLVTVENTDPEFFWLTSYIETALLRAVWYPTTVATMSYQVKKEIAKFLKETGTPGLIDFMLHDFGARGVSSFESSALGGMAHLYNFLGTDNLPAISLIRKLFDKNIMPGFSVNASEHSSTTSWGRENEIKAYENMLNKFAKKDAIVSIVSDSYDFKKALEMFGTTLKQQILDSGAKIVIRPDSGDPISMVILGLEELEKYFGATVNSKGYKVLNNVGIIQGDGINHKTVTLILKAMKINGYSADNVVFGMGGGLLQQVDRDTQKFAMKASAALIDGAWRDVYKDPITDKGKTSKKGRLTLIKNVKGEFETKQVRDGWQDFEDNEVLRTVWEDGQLVLQDSLATIWGRTKV